MNREIEFRGFWKDIKGNFHNAIGNLSIVNNELHKGCFISNEYGSPFAFEVIPETIGQYTGLKDKNDKKIFEGDIIIAHDTKFIVKFGAYRTKLFEKEYGSAIHTKQFGWYAESIKNKEQCNLVIPNGIEVIGNIYEDDLENEEIFNNNCEVLNKSRRR